MGNKTDSDVDYEKLVEEIDELLVKAFYESGLDKAEEHIPLRCYLMLKIILNKIGDFSPGMQISDVNMQMRNYLGENIKEVEGFAEKIAEMVKEIMSKKGEVTVNPTYLAASYWSPIDNQRHTALFGREEPNKKDEKKVLAYASAFFALTFFGAKNDFFSATQYTAVRATHKRGVRVSYQEKLGDGWWHIPKAVHQLILNDTGITMAIEEYLYDFSPEELRRGLRPLLAGQETDPDTNLKPFAKDFIKNFSSVRSRIREDKTYEYAEEARIYIETLLGDDFDFEKSLFMLMTNLIYDVAFPSNYFHAFPVRIQNLCSIITIGTETDLKPIQYLALDRIATSIFMHPLVLDYARQEKRGVESRNQMLLMGGCAHSANNALRMSGIESLIAFLSKSNEGEPPSRILFSLEDGRNEKALEKLRELWMGSKVAQAFISLVEMATSTGTIREKFVAERAYNLHDCLLEAKSMVNVHLEGHARGSQLPKSIQTIPADLKSLPNVQFPEGYLDKVYIQTFLYELLLNACKHGELYGDINASYAEPGILVIPEADGVQIQIINCLFDPEEMNWAPPINGVTFPKTTETDKRSSTFLQFASVISQYIKGIEIKSEVKAGKYIASLVLKAIISEFEDGTSRRQPIVSGKKSGIMSSNKAE